MGIYWVEQSEGKRGCVVGKQSDAERFGKVLGTLPYPASPVLGRFVNDRGYVNDCPPFCWKPDEGCLNRGACPRNYACDD